MQFLLWSRRHMRALCRVTPFILWTSAIKKKNDWRKKLSLPRTCLKIVAFFQRYSAWWNRLLCLPVRLRRWHSCYSGDLPCQQLRKFSFVSQKDVSVHYSCEIYTVHMRFFVSCDISRNVVKVRRAQGSVRCLRVFWVTCFVFGRNCLMMLCSNRGVGKWTGWLSFGAVIAQGPFLVHVIKNGLSAVNVDLQLSSVLDSKTLKTTERLPSNFLTLVKKKLFI